MHEYAVAQRVAETAAAYANGARVAKISLVIGESAGIAGESIRMLFDAITEGGPCEGAEIEIETIAPKLRCGSCGELFIRKPFSFRCACGGEGAPTEIGREFIIRRIEVMA